MGKVIVAIIMLIAGLGAGFGAGYFLMMPRINESAAEIDTLKQAIETAKADTEAVLKKAGKEISEAKTQAQKSQDNAIRIGKELVKMEAEKKRLELMLKKVMEQTSGLAAEDAPADSISKPTPVVPAAATTPATTATVPAATGATVEYTIKEGDSLWKIAATELGNGIRYKEILKLNPTINENSKLDIGMKLILPAK